VPVADTYLSLLADRPFRKALSPSHTHKQLKEMANNGWLSTAVVQQLEGGTLATRRPLCVSLVSALTGKGRATLATVKT
jgi:hypothetical protein